MDICISVIFYLLFKINIRISVYSHGYPDFISTDRTTNLHYLSIFQDLFLMHLSLIKQEHMAGGNNESILNFT